MSSNLRLFATAVFFSASLLLAGCGEGTASLSSKPPLPTPTPVGNQTPPQGTAYLGIYAPNGISQLESAMSRTFAMDVHYYTWAALFPNFLENQDLSNNRLVIDSWDCGPSNAQIAAGNDDALIITRAQAIKAFGHPVFLNYMWDANAQDSQAVSPVQPDRSGCHDSHDEANGVFSPAEYVAAYNHIRRVFAQQGVNNVVWVWSVSSAGSNPAAYYPGSANVDWVGIDAFNTQGDYDLAPTMSSIYSDVSGYGKPILLVAGASSITQSQYLTSVVPDLQTKFPAVSAFVYYNGKLGQNNWELSATFQYPGLQTFENIGSDPYFNAYATP